ncbi:MAG: hypothetical protein JWS10_605 [Cypionkella sp.]|nr:hypothetical protein [Cypionkella sp.]
MDLARQAAHTATTVAMLDRDGLATLWSAITSRVWSNCISTVLLVRLGHAGVQYLDVHGTTNPHPPHLLIC